MGGEAGGGAGGGVEGGTGGVGEEAGGVPGSGGKLELLGRGVVSINIHLSWRGRGCQGDAWYFFAREMFAIIGPMALAKVNSGATVGLDSVPVEVEVNIESHGFPAFNIVGLPDKAVEEAKEEVFREI